MYLTIMKSKTFQFALASLMGLVACTVATGQTGSEGSLPGIVVAKQSAQLSTAVSQVLNEVHVEPGQWVRKDQLLASLDSKIAQAEYAAARALASSGASVELTQIDVREAAARMDHYKQAYQRGAANEMEVKKAANEYNRAVATHQIAKDSLEQASQQAELARQRLELFSIRAPFEGQVDKIHQRPGNLVVGETPIITLIASHQLEVELHLPITRFGQLKVGETYSLRADAPLNREVSARLKYVSPNVDSTSGTFYCLFEIDNSGKTLPAGFTVQLPAPGEQFVSDSK